MLKNLDLILGDTKDFSVFVLFLAELDVTRFGVGEIRLGTVWRMNWGGVVATNIVVVKER